MRKTLVPLMLLAALVMMFSGCAKPPPPMEPSAQEFFDMGMAAFRQENFSQAASNFEMAANKSPSFTEAHYYLGLSFIKLNMTERAKQALSNAINLNSSHLGAREALGILLFNTSDYQGAKRQLEAARNLNSINPEAYLDLGKIYVMENRCPEALEVFQRGMTVDSTYVPLKIEYENARRLCGKSGGPAAPKVIYEKKFRGGGKAIDPSDF